MRLVFEPMIADARRECLARDGAARWHCALRWRVAFAMAFVRSLGGHIARPVPWELTLTTVRVVATFVAVGVTLEYLVIFLTAGVIAPARLVLATAPGFLPLALLPASIIVLSHRGGSSWQARLVLLRATLLCIVVMAPVIGWLVPHSNQAWMAADARGSGGRQTPARGVHALTLPELLADRPPKDALVSQAEFRNQRHLLASLVVTPLTFCVLGTAVARRARRHAVGHACIAWLITGFVWSWLIQQGAWLIAAVLWVSVPRGPLSVFELAKTPIGIQYWVPHVLFLSVAFVLHRWTSHQDSTALVLS